MLLLDSRAGMKRRDFITIIGGAALLSRPARAQHARSTRAAIKPESEDRVPLSRAADSRAPRVEIILEGLRMSGYRGPEQAQLVSRTADSDPRRLAPLAAELIEEKVDVVVAVSTAAVRAVQAASTTIPIVAHDLETDPVASGLVASYAQPGGNITGVFFDFPDFRTKWLELLHEVIRGLATVGLLWDPVSGVAQLEALQTAADQTRLKTNVLKVSTARELDEAFAAARDARVDALLILSSPFLGARARVLADLALRNKLPTVTLFPDFARAGGLIAYGPNLLDTYRPLGLLVGKILQGTKPGDLAVERPSKFELVFNINTAKELGVAIPTSILLRADEVVE
jgi:putative ABC transport system substrate-binding protein